VTRKRFLPKHVARYLSGGKWYYRYRRVGHPGGTFKSEFGTDEWRREYAAFESHKPSVGSPERYTPGSVGDALIRYYASDTRIGPTAVTRGKVKATLAPFLADFGHDRVNGFTFEHIDAIIARKLVKGIVQTPKGPRPVGGVFAAQKLRKELVRFFDFAVKAGMRRDNPAAISEKISAPKVKGEKGFKTWSEQDIAAYRDQHPLGTMARLALEMLLWTGQRRSDVHRMSPEDVREGRIAIVQDKTDKALWIPVAPQLLEAITAVEPPAPGVSFIRSGRGEPYSKESFGNVMRKWCDQAGLLERSAHGLRKAAMRRMAELGITNQGMKSISGHSRDDQVAHYTAAANQSKMADEAIARLSEWERGLSKSPVAERLTQA
jgi:integrase